MSRLYSNMELGTDSDLSIRLMTSSSTKAMLLDSLVTEHPSVVQACVAVHPLPVGLSEQHLRHFFSMHICPSTLFQ